MPSPSLWMRKPATTQSAVRSCLTFTIVRSPGVYGRSSGLATMPSSPAPSNASNQRSAVARSVVAGVSMHRRRGRASSTSSSSAAALAPAARRAGRGRRGRAGRRR